MRTIANEFLSSANFQQAWLQVFKNKGCAGSDGETIAQFQENLELNLVNLRNAIATNNYQPLPYKQVLIPKSQDKWRELKIPSVRDRIVQQALLNIISPLIEPTFSPCSFAYRPNISYIQAVEKIAYCRARGYQWVLDADIRKYFDNINHNRLLIELRKHINHPGTLCLIKAWICTKTLTNNGLVEPGTSIYKQYQRFVIHVPEKDRLEVPIREVEKILIFGNINLSTPVINACLQSQITVLFLSATAQYQGHLWSAEATNFNTEVLQLHRQQDERFQLEISRAIAFGKLMRCDRPAN